jgi:hypothetical protein
MMSRDRKVKLELTVSEAVALYYAAGALRDDIICGSDKTTKHPPVSGSRKTDRMIVKSLELLAAAIRKVTGLLTALAIVGGMLQREQKYSQGRSATSIRKARCPGLYGRKH